MAHILIVDDDEIVAEVASAALLDAGHICGWVGSGREALDLLRWRRPDVLLLDQDMPEMTGAQVLRELRTSPRHYDLPVIMFTGITGAADEQAARFNGAQAYLRKPFASEALLREIETLLNQRRTSPQHLALEDYLARSTGRWKDSPRSGTQTLRRYSL